ncbi:hypothetical protein pb186bvf_001267 [Paramecium bursaria]
MAFNPPVTQQGVPLRVDQEHFMLFRKDMECEVKIENMGKYTAKGKIYLTSCRIVFVNDKFQKETFKSFDFPLAYLTNEKFQQPVFGSNYLEGDVAPLYNLLPGKTHFKLWFQSGGCSTFLKLIVEVLRQIRQRRNQGQMGPDPRFINNLNHTQGQAFMDPNDPSVFYMVQPDTNQQAYGQQQWQLPQGFVQGLPVQQQGQPAYGQPAYGQPNQGYGQPAQGQYGQQGQAPYSQYPPQPPSQYPPPQQYQAPPQQYQAPPQQYQPQVQPPQSFPQQPPSTYPQQNQTGSNYNYPSLGEVNNQPQQPQQIQQPPPYQQPQQPYQQQPQYQQPQYQQPQPQAPQQIQPQPGQQPQQPNLAYYYGYWGPSLQQNNQL